MSVSVDPRERGFSAPTGNVSGNLLEVTDLKTYFKTMDGIVKAVDGVDMAIAPGKTLGVVGESGCGKSVTSLSIMRLVDLPGWIAGGAIRFDGKDLVKLSEEQMRHIRGNKISMIFQEPMTSLNPVFTVGNQVGEAIRVHRKVSKKEAENRVVELFRMVGIPSPDRRVHDYPHNMSGGMRQRVMIAMALALQPSLLIADEPTTALDVTIQAQILELIKDLRTKVNTAVLLITHDIGVVAEMADEVIVMYTGKVVEQGDVVSVLRSPKHPYTVGLLNSIPSLGQKNTRLNVIPGTVPSPLNLPKGCTFAPRCPHVMGICHEQEPPLKTLEGGVKAKCWLY
jgi:oligopeptide/dipeptide ABC transporter ATP-binding protein